MNFLPRDICEKLVEIGCKSESGLFYVRDYISPIFGDIYGEDKVFNVQAFIFQDLCGISEQSKMNRILFFECIDSEFINKRDMRDGMMDMTWDEWVEFIRNATK